jgi:hypothetical protein
VPNGATSATLSWTGLTASVDGAQPVVRLRLTSATLTDNAGTANLDERSQGAAPDGEVEDSLATVATLLPNDCANAFVDTFGAGAGRAQLPAGQTTYNYQLLVGRSRPHPGRLKRSPHAHRRVERRRQVLLEDVHGPPVGRQL